MNELINAMPLPMRLVEDLSSGKRPLPDEQKNALGAILREVEIPFPDLYDLETIRLSNKLWTSVWLDNYLGGKSDKHEPGDIDPSKAVIIGQAEPDSPIALDYRQNPPCVLYLGAVEGESYWIRVANSYEALIDKIGGRAESCGKP